jgi:hypothetical protein
MGVASLRQLILGLVICTAWTFSSTLLRADAESDSLFIFTPPAGWTRALGQDGIVYYINPGATANCRIYVSPPQEVSIDEFQERYNLLFDERISALGNMGYLYGSHHDPSFERSHDGSYYIYDQVVLENNEGDAIYYQAKFVNKGQHAQMLEWVGDLKKCAFASIQAKMSFDTVRLKAPSSNS